MPASFQSFGQSSHPYRAAGDTIVRLLRIFIPLVIVGAAFYFLVDRSQTVTGKLRVATDISGADIFIDGVRIGATTDTTLSGIIAGRRSVTVQKMGYNSEPEVVFVNIKQDTTTLINFKLIACNTESLSQSDSIASIEDMYEGIFSGLEEIPPRTSPWGPTTINSTEKAQELEAIEDDEVYTPNADHEIPKQALAPIVEQNIEGTSIAVSSVPQGAEIIVNGDSTGHQTNYTFHDLPRGTYFVTLRKKGYVTKPEETRIDLTRSYQSELVSFELSMDEMLPTPQLTITTEPVAAGIRVNGKPVGKGRIVVDVKLGESLVEFTDVIGYKTPASQIVDLTPEATLKEIVGNYERIEGKALLAFLPARQKTIEGDGLRVLVDNELLIKDPPEKFQGALIHALVAGKRLVRVEYQNLVQDIHIDLVDDKISIVTFATESFFSKKNLRVRSEEPLTLKDWQKRTHRLTIIDVK